MNGRIPSRVVSYLAMVLVPWLSPGRAERHGFEYYRHGTLSLYAALETRSGQVIGQKDRLNGARARSASV